MKRVVTGVNDEGRSYFMSVDEVDVSDSKTVWSFDPVQIEDWVEQIDPDVAARWIEPDAPGGVRWMYAVMQPHAEAGHSQRPGIDADGFHTTRTVDFVFIVDGEIQLILDEGEIQLAKGDVVVQQATRHAWKNLSDRPAIMLVLIHQPVGRRP